MKVIRSFRKEDNGWFLDLKDADASVAVDATTGDILLNEGAGEDRYNGAAISRSGFYKFRLNDLPGSEYQLVLKFGLTDSHVLGVTGDKEGAKTWIREATSAIKSPLMLKDLPVRLPPFALPDNCATRSSFRIRNSRVRDIKLILEPWGERYTIKPHAAIHVAFYGAPGERPEIETSDGAITFSAGRESLVRLYVASFGAWRGASPSEIVKEEVQYAKQFGEFELSEAGNAWLREEFPLASRAIEFRSLNPNVAYLRCSTIAKILAQSARAEYRLKRETVWRVTARMLQEVNLALELFESVSDEWLRRAEKDPEDDNWTWLESRSWDGVTPPEPSSLPDEAPATRAKNTKG